MIFFVGNSKEKTVFELWAGCSKISNDTAGAKYVSQLELYFSAFICMK